MISYTFNDILCAWDNNYKVNVPVCEHVPLCGDLFIFFSINISNDEKPYDNLYKHYSGIIHGENSFVKI